MANIPDMIVSNECFDVSAHTITIKANKEMLSLSNEFNYDEN